MYRPFGEWFRDVHGLLPILPNDMKAPAECDLFGLNFTAWQQNPDVSKQLEVTQ